MAEPVVAGGGPIAVDVVKGQFYHWCSCGRSKNQPFCDGSHEGTPFMPLPWVADKDGKQFLCACKATSNPPFCDGSHAKPDVLKRYNRQLLEANSKLRDEVARITALLQDKTA